MVLVGIVSGVTSCGLWHDHLCADMMHSKVPPRNRLAKPLPEEWRNLLVERGVPKRKYAAVLKLALADGRVIAEAIIEEGWIVGLDRQALSGQFEQRIDFDPRSIVAVEVIQVV